MVGLWLCRKDTTMLRCYDTVGVLLMIIIICDVFARKSLENICSITASRYQHTTWFPILREGDDFNAWQVYTTTGNASDLAVEWFRAPSLLQCSVYSNSTVIVNPHTINVTITINDTRADGMCSDQGFYQITVTSNCGSNSMVKFHLNFVGHCTSILPDPAESKMVVVAEPRPGDSTTFNTTVRYYGSSSINQFDTEWHLGFGTCSDDPLCADDDADNDGRFKCNRTDVSNCTFLSNFYIHNYSKLQSGNYTTNACPVESRSGSGSNTSQVSTLDLRILGWPHLTHWPGSAVTSALSGDGTWLTYQLSNFSLEFLNLMFYNGSELINVSTGGYKMDVICDNVKCEMATVQWQVPAEGLYHMCYSFSSVVQCNGSSLNCTDVTQVVANELLVEILVPVAAILLLVILLIMVCVICVCIKRKKPIPSEQTPLLEEGNQGSDSSSTSSGDEAPSPGSQPTLKLSSNLDFSGGTTQTDAPGHGSDEALPPGSQPVLKLPSNPDFSGGTTQTDAPRHGRDEAPPPGSQPTLKLSSNLDLSRDTTQTDAPGHGNLKELHEASDIGGEAPSPGSQPTLKLSSNLDLSGGTTQTDALRHGRNEAPSPGSQPTLKLSSNLDLSRGTTQTDAPGHGRAAEVKAFILSPYNPNEYVHILPPNELQQHPKQHPELLREYEVEVEESKARMEGEINEHQRLMTRLAHCLEARGITVTGVHQLRDSAVSNIVQWADEQIKNSNFVILIITPSFSKFLEKLPPPEKEHLFGATGGYVSRLLHHPPEGLTFLPVFLNRFEDIKLLPIVLRGRPLYQIFEPFEMSLEQLYSVLTKPV